MLGICVPHILLNNLITLESGALNISLTTWSLREQIPTGNSFSFIYFILFIIRSFVYLCSLVHWILYFSLKSCKSKVLISFISDNFQSHSSLCLKACPSLWEFAADANAWDLARELCMLMKETGAIEPIEQKDWLDVELIESKIL